MISIVIPALNEASSIRDVIMRCYETLAPVGRDFEVVVVDDGSSDETGAIAAEDGATVVRHPHNLGYGRSLKDGIRAARYDTIVITDADGTYPIERIPELLEIYDSGFNMVVAERHGEHYEESAKKMLLRRLLKLLVEFTAGREIPDINSGLRVFSRTDVIPYFRYLSETFSFTTSMTLAYMLNGMFVTYVPVEYHERVGKSKVRLFRDSLRTLQFITEGILSFNPIKLFIVFSGLLALLSLLAMAAAMLMSSVYGFILGTAFLVVSFLVFGMGLISVQLKQLLHVSDTDRTNKEPVQKRRRNS